MKIHIKGRPKQFAFVKVTCLDSLMVEMLSCVPDVTIDATPASIAAYRKIRSPQFIYQFLHGAQLTVGIESSEFFIQGRMPDGSDTLAAVEELHMLDALRIAKKHFLAMKKACFNPAMDSLSLRVTRY